MRVRTFIQPTLSSVAVLFICGFVYVRFLTTRIPYFLSINEWSILGFIVVIFVGVVCRLLVRSRSTMGFLAMAGLIGGSIFTEWYYHLPLSHDAVAGSTWLF